MGFYEYDRIRHKNREINKKPKKNESYFKLELHDGVPVTEVIEALAAGGLSIKLDVNNRITVKR